MIEISSPIQTHSSQDPGAENPVSSSVFKSGTQKKGKLGAFSMLLEGLTGKSKVKNRGESVSPDLIGQTRDGGEVREEKSGKKAARKGKSVFFHEESVVQEQIFPVFLQNTEQKAGETAENLNFSGSKFPGVEEIPALNTGQAYSEAGLNADGAFLSSRIRPDSAAAAAEAMAEDVENQLAEGELFHNELFFPLEEKGESVFSSPAEADEGRLKKPRGVVDLFSSSARNTETEIFRFSGEKRPGLVDVLSGLTSASDEAKDAAKLPEGRAKRKTERFSLEVRDLRSAETSVSAENLNNSANAVLSAEKIDAEIVTDLRNGSFPRGQGGEVPGAQGGFEEALSRELGNHLSGDIVKQASLILRDGGEGIIRLSLKPETLGNIKIRLEMTENKITGHIVVESSEAFKAFERELPVLEKQFQESGFGEASLEMSFARDGASYFGAGNGENRNETAKFSQAIAAVSYDAGTEREAVSPGASDGISGISAPQNAVNILI